MSREMQEAETAPPMVDPEFVEEFGEQMKDAWNSHDSEAVALLCTEDVSWADGALPRPAQGREEVAAFVRATAHAFPDFRVEEQENSRYVISPTLPRVFVPYRMSGTMLGGWEPLGAAPTKRQFSVDGIDQWTFRGGLLCHYATYYDALEVARQLGIVPKPETLGLRAAVYGQRLQAAYLRRTGPRARPSR